jgi:aryl-alcohol dehydrogenase-like predicted oxidoreductase
MGTMQFGWSLGEADSDRVLTETFEAGINFFDTADVYSNWVEGNPGGVSETYLGNWIKRNKIPRDQIILATKVRGKMGEGPDNEGLGRAHIMKAIEGSLKRLQTDFIDLYQSHSPDDNTPIEETLRAYDDLVRLGKVRYIGASNYKSAELMHAMLISGQYNLVRYDCLQPHYNLIWREEFEAELRDLCETYKLGVIPYSPLAGGFLTGKYRKGWPLPESKRAQGRTRALTDRNFALIDKMNEISRAHHATISQVALAWMLADPVITSPIIGVTSIEQLKENVGALELRLTPEEIDVLNNMTAWKRRD